MLVSRQVHDCVQRRSWLGHEDLQQLIVLRGAQTRNRIPARSGGESIGAAAGISTLCKISERPCVGVQDRIDESDLALAARQPLVVDARDE